MESSESSSASSPLNLAPPAPSCPPPLAWTQVLEQFRAAAVPFEVAGDGEPIRGLTFGSGQPLYVLNAWSGTSEVFCLMAWLLREQFRLVLIDYPQSARNWDTFKDCPARVATFLGDEHYDLLATGFGSVPALLQALTPATGLRRLVLQSSIVSYRLSWLERAGAAVFSVLPASIRNAFFRTRLLYSQHRLWFPPIDETRWQFLAANCLQTPLKVVAQRFRLLHGLDLTSRLKDVRQPVLLVDCEGEPQRNKQANQVLGRELPDATYEAVPNCGQVPHVTHPHRLAGLLKKFLLPQES